MNSLKNTRILFLFVIALMFSHYGSGQVCEDSTQLYSLNANMPMINRGNGFIELSNGNFAYMAWPLGASANSGHAGIVLTASDGVFIGARSFFLPTVSAQLTISHIAAAPDG